MKIDYYLIVIGGKINILKTLAVISFTTTFFTGCTSINEHSSDVDAKSKEFGAPSEGMAGIYIVMQLFLILTSGTVGVNFEYAKSIKIDNVCVGKIDEGYYFHEEVKAGKVHTISTESEFGYNELKITPKVGKNYFIAQSLKVGVLVAGSELKEVSEDTAREIIQKSKLAKHGKCSGN